MESKPPHRPFLERSRVDRSAFALGVFLVAMVLVLFRPNETVAATHKLLGRMLGKE